MGAKIRWGIIGTGWIAAQFAEGLAVLPNAELAAVGSRTKTKAAKFARKYQAPRSHGSYEALANDPEIDAVYVATPHSLHAENSLMGLEAGKPVLCEKPFTINAKQAEQVIKKARAKKLLLMEAMWSRFLPSIVKVRELLAEKAIGDVLTLEADFGFRAWSRTGRLFDPDRGGGALLDVGVYPVALASMIFGPPIEATGTARIGPTGVDEDAAVVLKHSKDRIAFIHTSIRSLTSQTATISGSDGKIELHSPWWKGAPVSVTRKGAVTKKLKFPFRGNGYDFQAAAFMECMRRGEHECDVMPLNETLSIMRTLDGLRAQWGLKYPME